MRSFSLAAACALAAATPFEADLAATPLEADLEKTNVLDALTATMQGAQKIISILTPASPKADPLLQATFRALRAAGQPRETIGATEDAATKAEAAVPDGELTLPELK